MDNYIVINGKKAELTEEQLKALGLVIPEKNPFNRIEKDEKFFYMNGMGTISIFDGGKCIIEQALHEAANYCTDKDLLQQRAYWETLNRLLWRYSMEHDGDKIDWNNDIQKLVCIIYNYEHCDWHCVGRKALWRTVGVPYFVSFSVARAAIEEVVIPFCEAHPDFDYKRG